MRILGIDPGFERVGMAIIEKPDRGKEIYIHSQCFKTSASLPFNERLFLIGQEVDRICTMYEPSLLSIETLFFNSNQKTALFVAEARGVIMYEACKKGLTVCEYTPLQIKNAVTGYGRATKDQVDTMVRHLLPIPSSVCQDDEMDALAAALTGAASFRSEKIS